MTSHSFYNPDPFASLLSVFGAFEPASMKLLLVVEAESFDQAQRHVDAVAPLFGVKRGSDLVVEYLEEMPAGIPTFLMAFFEAGKIGVKRGDVAPGTGTLH